MAENMGCAVDVVQLHDEHAWELDVDELRAKVGPRTKLLAVVNPNNPTGTILSAEARAAILDVVESTGCWLLADEVYRGSERDGVETQSFWAQHPRALAVNSLSKAYGLCGLRIGWVVAPQPLADELRRRHEYAVISASLPSVFLAERALEPAKRDELLARQRELVRDGAEVYARWLDEHAALISAQPTAATALSFPRYSAALPSEQVADAIRTRGIGARRSGIDAGQRRATSASPSASSRTSSAARSTGSPPCSGSSREHRSPRARPDDDGLAGRARPPRDDPRRPARARHAPARDAGRAVARRLAQHTARSAAQPRRARARHAPSASRRRRHRSHGRRRRRSLPSPPRARTGRPRRS